MQSKIKVPEGMLKAACYVFPLINDEDYSKVRSRLEAALRWLSENPIVPTGEQMNALTNEVPYQDSGNGRIFHVVIDKWQRRMFVEQEPCRVYREIQLTQGKVALVDLEDFERLNAVKWYVQKSKDNWYALRHVNLENGKRGVSSMHREVIGANPGEIVDHENRDGLDNRRQNLRRTDLGGNAQNVGPTSDKQTSKYKGVCRNEAKGKYMSRIGYEGEMHHIGYFDDEEEAARAYDREAFIHHGEFAYLNFPDDIRMFLAAEPEVPEAVKDLLGDPHMTHTNACILEAYRRGQKAGNNV